MINILPVKRDLSLDTLRGIMLVVMTINHVNSPIEYLTSNPFGMFGAAEGFIYLSGLVFGLVYTKFMNTSGALRKATLKRILTIYYFHIGTFILVYIFKPNMFPNGNFLEYLWHIATLTFRPWLFDILPVYMFLLLGGWFALELLKRYNGYLVLLASFIIYLLPLVGFEFNPFKGMNSQLIDLGTFNIFSFQFLFTVGVWTGFNRRTGQLKLSYNKFIAIPIISIAALFIVIRYAFNLIDFPEWYFTFLEKKTLGPVRLASFMAFAYFVSWLLWKGVNLNNKWLASLGKYSLEIFAYHVALMYIVGVMRWNFWIDLLVSIVLLTSLSIPGKIKDFLKDREKKLKLKRE